MIIGNGNSGFEKLRAELDRRGLTVEMAIFGESDE